MPRLTMAQVRASRIPGVLGKCSTSTEILSFINEAQMRLLPKARWWNTYARLQICTVNGNLTWPRCVAAIESVAVCDTPIVIRNEFFEFIENGIGIQRRDGTTNGGIGPGCSGQPCGLQLLDRGTSCLIADVTGIKKLRVYIDNASDLNKRILIKGKDENGNKIYTLDAGAPVEGFYITLAAAPVLTTQLVTEIYGVIKDFTLGNVRVYQFDPGDSSQSLILNADPDEIVPNYRRSLIRGLDGTQCCSSDTETDCADGETQITAEVKLEFIPVGRDTDFLTIDWIPALKEMCQSIWYGEKDSMEAKHKAAFHEARAIKALDDELAHYIGDGMTVPIEIDSTTWGMAMADVR